MTSGTNPVSDYAQTNFTVDTGTAYKTKIDKNFIVAQRVVDNFAPRQTATPAMTVTLDAGHIFAGTTLTEVASQVTGTITAPIGNPRIDRVVIDRLTGVFTVVTGTPAASPAAPAIPSGKSPVCQVLLQTTSTTITNAMITDERDFSGLGHGTAGEYNVGTAANNVVQLTAAAKLPAVDASLLTNLSVTVAEGGTGLSTLTANNVILGNGTAAPQFVAPGASGNVLTSNGTTWQSSSPAVNKYTSPQQTLTSGGTLTLGHGLGAAPYLVTAQLVAQNSVSGYTAGDVLTISLGAPVIASGAAGAGVAVRVDATNLYVTFSSNPQIFSAMLNPTNGTSVTFTNSDWRLVLTALA